MRFGQSAYSVTLLNSLRVKTDRYSLPDIFKNGNNNKLPKWNESEVLHGFLKCTQDYNINKASHFVLFHLLIVVLKERTNIKIKSTD